MQELTLTAEQLKQIIEYLESTPSKFSRPILNFLETVIKKAVEDSETPEISPAPIAAEEVK